MVLIIVIRVTSVAQIIDNLRVTSVAQILTIKNWLNLIKLNCLTISGIQFRDKMSSGIVTKSFEELKDTMPQNNHIRIMQDKIRESLLSVGKKYNGQEIDGRLYPENERLVIATHKGPMLAKFKCGKPEMEVRYEMKKEEGRGKGSLAGRRSIKLNWYGCKSQLMIDPKGSRGRQDQVGWCDKGIDYSKSGSIYSTITEWLPHMGLSEVDPITMGGLLDSLSGEDCYTMMFIKGILTLRTLSVSYSVEGSKISCIDKLPEYVSGDKRTKVGQVGVTSATIDIDVLTDKETLTAMLCSSEYPSVVSELCGQKCVYSQISIPKCDVTFVGSEGRKITKVIPTPERWWKQLVNLACKLGAVEDLITAFRITRGLGCWLDGIEKLGIKRFGMDLDIPKTRGCRTILMDSNLSRVDRVEGATNMASSLGELVCDWGVGLEMRNILMHLSDEFGLGNKEMNRNVIGEEECSVGDSMLREGGFFDYGEDNTFYNEMMIRTNSIGRFLGNEDIKRLIQKIGRMSLVCGTPGGTEERSKLREFKNVGFSAYFGKMWNDNCTMAVGEEGKINSSTWGATSKSRSEVYKLRIWLDIYGLSEQCLVLCGYNAVQKNGIESISHGSMGKFEGANGVYSEVYREINWRSDYESRIGSETLEKDRLDFVKTYLGMEDEGEIIIESEEAEVEYIGGKEPRDEFRGSLKIDVESSEELDVTTKIKKVKKTPPNMGERHIVGRRIRETLSHKGLSAFIRDVSATGADLKVKQVAGDGYCVAHALSEGMKELGMAVTSEEMIEYLQRETEDGNWFEVEKASLLMDKLGLGVAIYDTRNKNMYGIGTAGREAEEIIGITYDGIHCDTLSRGLGDYSIPQEGEANEKSRDELEEIMEGMFGKRR